MANVLQRYFPIIRDRQEVMEEIRSQASDTGLQMDLLQEYTFIAIDNFKKI